MPTNDQPNRARGVFVVIEEMYGKPKIFAVALTLNGAKDACMRAMGLPVWSAKVYWVDQDRDHPFRKFHKDQGYLEMYHDGEPWPFRIEWKSLLP